MGQTDETVYKEPCYTEGPLCVSVALLTRSHTCPPSSLCSSLAGCPATSPKVHRPWVLQLLSSASWVFLGHNSISPGAFFLDFIYLFIFKERGREGGREGKKHQCVVASRVPPTGDLARTPGCSCPDWESNRQCFGLQTGTQSTQPHHPGQTGAFPGTGMRHSASGANAN